MKLNKLFAATALCAVFCAGVAVAQYNTLNYQKQGGAEWDVGGVLNVNSGGVLDVKPGASVVVEKTAVTANAGNSYTVTANSAAGVVTTDALTTAAGGSQAIVINDSLVTATSAILIGRNGGTSTAGTPSIKAVPGTGTITLTIDNKHASAAFNGTFVISYVAV